MSSRSRRPSRRARARGWGCDGRRGSFGSTTASWRVRARWARARGSARTSQGAGRPDAPGLCGSELGAEMAAGQGELVLVIDDEPAIRAVGQGDPVVVGVSGVDGGRRLAEGMDGIRRPREGASPGNHGHADADHGRSGDDRRFNGRRGTGADRRDERLVGRRRTRCRRSRGRRLAAQAVHADGAGGELLRVTAQASGAT